MNTHNNNGATIVIGDEAEVAAPAGAVVIQESMPTAVVDEDADIGEELPARARRNDDGSITLPLRVSVPVTIRKNGQDTHTETYASFTFHRLNGADFRAISSQKSDEGKSVVLLARSARVREQIMNAVFDRMDAVDISDAIAVVSTFLSSGSRSGKTSR